MTDASYARMTVLFLCPHNAAKSILAAAYFTRSAVEAGLPLRADSAGTEPDDAVSGSVIDLLRADGLEPGRTTPRRVTAEDLAQADVVVSMGCRLPEPAGLAGRVEHWDDVPLPSQDLERARDVIRDKVEGLIAELCAARRD